MSEETWNVELGDRTFTVPRLPFKVSRIVYPICQRLSNSDILKRLTDFGNRFAVTDEEMDDLAKVALLACQVTDSNLTPESFGEMPIKPSQLFDAFVAIRYACGGWTKVVAPKEGENTPGEELGAELLPT